MEDWVCGLICHSEKDADNKEQPESKMRVLCMTEIVQHNLSISLLMIENVWKLLGKILTSVQNLLASPEL